MLTMNSRVTIVRGCEPRTTKKNEVWTVAAIVPLGRDYSHAVRVVLSRGDRSVAWYARHQNRLADTVVNLNDGNPLHKIQVRLAE